MNQIDNHSIEERTPLVCRIRLTRFLVIVQNQQFVNDCKTLLF